MLFESEPIWLSHSKFPKKATREIILYEGEKLNSRKFLSQMKYSCEIFLVTDEILVCILFPTRRPVSAPVEDTSDRGSVPHTINCQELKKQKQIAPSPHLNQALRGFTKISLP